MVQLKGEGHELRCFHRRYYRDLRHLLKVGAFGIVWTVRRSAYSEFPSALISPGARPRPHTLTEASWSEFLTCLESGSQAGIIQNSYLFLSQCVIAHWHRQSCVIHGTMVGIEASAALRRESNYNRDWGEQDQKHGGIGVTAIGNMDKSRLF